MTLISRGVDCGPGLGNGSLGLERWLELKTDARRIGLLRFGLSRGSSRVMRKALGPPSELLDRKLEACSTTLIEAHRLIAVRVYGPILTHSLNRVHELIEEITEILGAVEPEGHHQAFAKANSFRREHDKLLALAARGLRGAARRR